jgi:sulfur carrier protein
MAASEGARREVTVNGEPRATRAADVAALLAELGHRAAASGVAVAVNGAVVPRSAWAAHPLCEGDAIEIVGAVQGG